ncbi:MAG: hypothetical protein PWR01_3200 [Clostridiales bacterium]|jgi:hypothetical protein|nr:hypothetical protein [Clostridiales bacterium]MDN5282127.1 hypothetical protein [Candidatus Ozemobacter sp.]
MNQIYERMLTALKVLTANVGEGWFIIMEEPESEFFVQFAFDEGSGLVFDCPTMSFSEEEMARATRVMQRFGIELENLSDDEFASFNADIGMDIEKAAQIGSSMFREVFMFSDNTPFNIVINC